MAPENLNPDFERVAHHWIETSEEDFKTMMQLFQAGSYRWALFLGHISAEKLLKALYVRAFNDHAPYIHNLFRLAELVKLPIDEQYADWLDTITTFNLNARYDDHRRDFYSKCTKAFAYEWIEKITTIRIWIKEKL